MATVDTVGPTIWVPFQTLIENTTNTTNVHIPPKEHSKLLHVQMADANEESFQIAVGIMRSAC